MLVFMIKSSHVDKVRMGSCDFSLIPTGITKRKIATLLALYLWAVFMGEANRRIKKYLL